MSFFNPHKGVIELPQFNGTCLYNVSLLCQIGRTRQFSTWSLLTLFPCSSRDENKDDDDVDNDNDEYDSDNVTDTFAKRSYLVPSVRPQTMLPSTGTNMRKAKRKRQLIRKAQLRADQEIQSPSLVPLKVLLYCFTS